MRIAFYAPLKPPDHPVPSGDRQMARQLIAALAAAGHSVELASTLRSYRREPSLDDLQEAANLQAERLLRRWQSAPADVRPELWFSYHPYYKAPDLLGPPIARALGISYVTAEASYAGKRDRDAWRDLQAFVVDGVRQASLNICFTEVDRAGLSRIAKRETLVDLAPFVDMARFRMPPMRKDRSRSARLVTVAMMRQDVKLESYRALAEALQGIETWPWELTVVGDGPARPAVMDAFGWLDPARVRWAGLVAPDLIPALLGEADVFVWPGVGEAYGIAYLEAQAAGLPVVAFSTHGVPSVVRNGETGLLVPPGNTAEFGRAVRRMIEDSDLRASMGAAAKKFVREERSIDAAARTLGHLLGPFTARSRP